MGKVQRNDVCPCGSQKKYKRCCAIKDAAKKQKKFSGLKGLNVYSKQGDAPMKSLAGKVFNVLSSTMTAPSLSLADHAIKQQDHIHGDSCGCHISSHHEEEVVGGKYTTLEDLISSTDASE